MASINTTTLIYIKVDCEWSPFDEWTSCSVSCGGGTRSSVRQIIQPAENNGKACTGYSTRTESCNTIDCPEPGNVFKFVFVV